MKLLKILKWIFGVLSALSATLGIAAYMYYFDKTAECPYCALPEGLSNEEIQAALAETHDLVAVLEHAVDVLFACFWIFLLVFLMIIAIDLFVRRANFLREHEAAQWHGHLMETAAVWWKKHDAAMTVIKSILGVLSCFGGLMVLVLTPTGIGPVSAIDIPMLILEMALIGAFCLIPLWILLALLGIERKIKKEKQRLSSSEETI